MPDQGKYLGASELTGWDELAGAEELGWGEAEPLDYFDLKYENDCAADLDPDWPRSGRD